MTVAEQTDSFRFPILVGDVGGTNARFAVLPDASAGLSQPQVVKTASFKTLDDAIRATVIEDMGIRPRTALIAVAGVVDGEEIPLTNCHWVMRPRPMLAALGVADVVVLNDFEAQALAVAALGPEHMEQIGGGQPLARASRVVLGPGTGLGVAGLVQYRGIWIPVPGEGGHMDIGPRTAREVEVFAHIEKIEGRLSGEQILCGSGLLRTYEAVALADGKPHPLKDPSDVTRAAFDGSDAAAKEALEIFVRCLGRTAGDLALVFKSRGGVFLSGGIAQKIVPALKTGAFRAAFEDKAPHTDMMRAMPVHVMTHPLAALLGLAAYATAPGNYGVETQGRRWQS